MLLALFSSVKNKRLTCKLALTLVLVALMVIPQLSPTASAAKATAEKATPEKQALPAEAKPTPPATKEVGVSAEADKTKPLPPIKLKFPSYAAADTLAVIKAPAQYINKPIQLEGVFSSFSGLGLDYKKALRPAKQYITMLLIRPDVTHHKIPMGELKLFFPREQSDRVMKLEAGDTVSIKGSVFSAALGDAWMDAEMVTVLEKTKTPSHTPEESPLE